MNLITPEFGLIFWQTVILLVVLCILKKYAWHPILNALEERQKNIQNNLDAANKAKSDVAAIETICKNMRLKAEKESNLIIKNTLERKKEILKKANEEAIAIKKNMLLQAQEAITQEKKKSFNQNKQAIILLSIQIAEKILIKKLGHDHESLLHVKKILESHKN